MKHNMCVLNEIFALSNLRVPNNQLISSCNIPMIYVKLERSGIGFYFSIKHLKLRACNVNASLFFL